MDRKKQHKHVPKNADALRAKRRKEAQAVRKAKRDQVLKGKRVRNDTLTEEDDFTVAQVEEITQQLLKKDTETRTVQEALRLLRKAFGQGTSLIDAFVNTEGSMECLVGYLTGADSDLQLAATACLTNMAAGTENHAELVLKQAGAYLVTYLSGDSHTLQDQCSFVLGNIAGDSAQLRDTLRAQGVEQPLINLLKSSTPRVVQSAGFALSNMARDRQHSGNLIKAGILPLLANNLTTDAKTLDGTAEVAWVATYLAAGGDHEDAILEAGILDKIVEILVHISEQELDKHQVATPVLRCLGNLCSGHDDVSKKACENESLLPTLKRLLQSTHRPISKETLWVLSNMTGSSDVAQKAIQEDLVTPVCELLNKDIDVKKEAGYMLCNMAFHGAENCEALLKAGAVKAVIPMLKAADTEANHLALCFLEMVFRLTDKAVGEFEANEGMDGLEVLEYHSDEEIKLETNDLLTKYFYKDEDKEDIAEEHVEAGQGDAKVVG